MRRGRSRWPGDAFGGAEAAAALGDRPLLLHGTSDNIVNHRHGPIIRDAAKNAGVDVELLTFEGVGHVDWIDQDPGMREAIIAFFREHVLPAGG